MVVGRDLQLLQLGWSTGEWHRTFQMAIRMSYGIIWRLPNSGDLCKGCNTFLGNPDKIRSPQRDPPGAG